MDRVELMENHNWFGLYRASWGREIVPEAYGHPAKFARGLIRRIYAHALERGYLQEGAVVIDPFAGVALGALDAMFHGLHFIGCELEDKFVQLGQQNIDLWNRRYGGGKLRRWGTAVLAQGDSRRLCEVLEGARAEGKPSMRCPYCGSTLYDEDITRDGEALRCADCGNRVEFTDAWDEAIWTHPPQAMIASPPFSNSQQVDNRTAPVLIEGSSWKKRQGSITVGTSPAQLGNMPTGEPPQAVIASPPYAVLDTGGKGGEGPGSAGAPNAGKLSGASSGIGYGRSDGQLAALPEGEPPAGIVQVDACVSSPPWEESLGSTDLDFIHNRLTTGPSGSTELRSRAKSDGQVYGCAEGQLGAEAGKTFWSAAKTILLQCHAVLAPGGVAIWVLKAFVRNKAIVDFPGQWEALCNSCGFETIEVIRAWLVEDRGAQFALNGDLVEKKVARKSFFRRLHEKNYPDLAIDYEIVLITRKGAA